MWRFSPENFSLLTPEKEHFGGYLMHSDVLNLKLWFAVHRILQGCATDSVTFSTSRIKLSLNLTITRLLNVSISTYAALIHSP